MTIIVTVKVNDGVVLAADSASSFFAGGDAPVKIYNNANKIFNLMKVWPVGALVYGSGGVGQASIETLTKDLRSRLSDPNDSEYHLNRSSYTIEEVATKARKFIYEGAYKKAYPTEPPPNYFMGYRICGYSAGSPLPEVWEFLINGSECAPPYGIQTQDEFGVRWAGENEALDRLLLGTSSALVGFLVKNGVDLAVAQNGHLEFIREAGVLLAIPAMPIQDAIEVARFCVEVATKFARYGLRPETIGGPVETAAITKHEGFKWVARKHYYSAELNRETTHGL